MVMFVQISAFRPNILALFTGVILFLVNYLQLQFALHFCILKAEVVFVLLVNRLGVFRASHKKPP